MAKSKPVPKSETKKFVSTSAIYKRFNQDKSRKSKAPKTCHVVKKKGAKDCHNSTRRKSKRTPDHPLALAFTCKVSINELEQSVS